MPDQPIDLRSDTVTRPTPAMRAAMARADVGDDVFGEDPTVNALEERAADLLGKDAGLFVASGTMGNLVAQLAHLRRGEETITGMEQHIAVDEAAGHAVVAGTSLRTLQDRPDGTLDLDAIEDAITDESDPHQAATGMIAVEDTHLHSMGQPLPMAYLAAVGSIAHRHGVAFHIDGARFWNAVVALRADGWSARDVAEPADSITFCLSKGLGCPVGSILVGSHETIRRARRARKLVGGGMRQAGVLAAAGLVALQDGPAGMIDRLADDHANARRLAEAIADLDGIVAAGGVAQPTGDRLDPTRVRTNIVLFRVDRDRAAFLAALRGRGVLMTEFFHGQVRAATNNDVAAGDLDQVIRATREALDETRSTARAVTV